MADACCGPEADSTNGEPEEQSRPATVWRIVELQAAAVSGLLLLIGAILPASTAETVLFWAAAAAGGASFVPSALRGLLNGRLGVGLLMTIAAVGALALGEIGEAATLAFLFSIAEGLEGYAITKTRHGLRALLDLAPATAHKLIGAHTQVVAVEQLLVGDIIVIKPGEKVGTDGTVVAGRTSVDTSVVTGESLPVEVGIGSPVFAGTVNGTGSIDVQVTATAADNSLARLVHVVQEAQDRKGASQRLAERVARPLVPGVLIVAGVVALVGSLVDDPAVWIPRALVVLVAAAPCAFALSVPIAVLTAIGTASKAGVLIRGGAAVEALGSIRVVALDKTGTLTRNQPSVIDVVTVGEVTRTDVLGVAAALELRSEHPLAAAITAAVFDPLPAVDVEAVPGQGLVGSLDGRVMRLGKPGFVDEGPLGRDVARLQNAGATVVLVERDGVLMGAIAVRDEIRPEAAEAVAMLRRLGVAVVMLTGDNRRTAAAIAAQAGIGEVRAELSPEGKAALVTELAHRGPVAMVGDGINDAPALATARVGIAMGAMGSDVAIEAADVALMGEDLRRLPDAIAHARAARRIFTQNLVLSSAILVALVPLAGLGVLGLASVVAFHELAEVVVILNGIRSGRRRHLPRRATVDQPHQSTLSPIVSGDGDLDPQRDGLFVLALSVSTGRPENLLTLTANAPNPTVQVTDGQTCGCEPGCACCSGPVPASSSEVTPLSISDADDVCGTSRR